jgi:hypothetical protein
MDQLLDIYLSRILKNWVAVPKPPVNGRSRLLREAAKMEQSRAREIGWFNVRSLGDMKTHYYIDLYWPVMDSIQSHSAMRI